MFLNVSYGEWIGYIICIIGIILVSMPNGWLKRFEKYYSSDHLHKPIHPEQVENTVIRGKLATDIEQEQLIHWFNQSGLVQKIETPQAQEEQPVINIQLKDGDQIALHPYKNDFLVTRATGTDAVPITYWAKHPELAGVLSHVQSKQGKWNDPNT